MECVGNFAEGDARKFFEQYALPQFALPSDSVSDEEWKGIHAVFFLLIINAVSAWCTRTLKLITGSRVNH